MRFDILFAVLAVMTAFEKWLWHTPITPWLKASVLFALLIHLGLVLRKVKRTTFHTFIFVGLFASALGDVVIEFSFITGIVAFFLAHVFYLVAMGIDREHVGQQLLWMLPSLVFVAVVFSLVHEGIPDPLFIPVMLYMAIISCMISRATFRGRFYPATTATRYMWLGAWLFGISDAYIAVNKWSTPLPMAPVLILCTYYTGQYFIARSAEVDARLQLPASP